MKRKTIEARRKKAKKQLNEKGISKYDAKQLKREGIKEVNKILNYVAKKGSTDFNKLADSIKEINEKNS